jgi:hypothetical protein
MTDAEAPGGDVLPRLGPIRPIAGRDRIPAARLDVRFDGWPPFTVTLTSRRGGVALTLPQDGAGDEALILPPAAHAMLRSAIAAALQGDDRARDHLHRPGTPMKVMAQPATALGE